MRRHVRAALGAVAAIALLVLWFVGDRHADRAAPFAPGADAPGPEESTHPPGTGLAGPPHPAGAAAERPAVAPKASSEAAIAAAPSPTAPRRAVRARFVAVDALSYQRVDPGAPFTYSLDADCEDETLSWPTDGAQEVAVKLPRNAEAATIVLQLHAWGYRRVREAFELVWRGPDAVLETQVPLTPIDAAGWEVIRVKLPGVGDRVLEREALRLFVEQWSDESEPRRPIDFAAGTARVREVRVPFPAAQASVRSAPRRIVEEGRTVDERPARIRVERDDASADAFVVERLPAGTLEVELRYADVARPPSFLMFGTWNYGRPGGRNTATTFSVHVEGGPDVVRVEREEGRLDYLKALGFELSLDPEGPMIVRVGETTRVRATLRRMPSSPK